VPPASLVEMREQDGERIAPLVGQCDAAHVGWIAAPVEMASVSTIVWRLANPAGGKPTYCVITQLEKAWGRWWCIRAVR
jgi:hypothetical protein